MDTNSTNQWKHSSQKSQACAVREARRDGPVAMDVKPCESKKQRQTAVAYLNRLNQTQWQKITEYLTAKFSTQSLAKDKAINRVRTKTN